jgi:hypothetical protein
MSKAQEAWERAAKYSERAQVTTDEETRQLFTYLRNRWIKVANGSQVAAMYDPVGLPENAPVEKGEGLPG